MTCPLENFFFLPLSEVDHRYPIQLDVLIYFPYTPIIIHNDKMHRTAGLIIGTWATPSEDGTVEFFFHYYQTGNRRTFTAGIKKKFMCIL